VPWLELLLLTLEEAQALAGSADPEACAQALLAPGARAVAIKLGREGCLLAAEGEVIRLPAFAIEARDSTGAGDAFDAGVIAGYLGGVGWPAAAALGNALGAVAAGRVGAADQAPDAAEACALLAAHLKEPSLAAHRPAIEGALRFVQAGLPRA